jgi:hypothetical protein
MWGWAKRLGEQLLRQKLATAQPVEASSTLEVWLDNQWTPCRALAARGIMLVCSPSGRAAATRMVSASEARDQDAFWEIWRRLSSGTHLVWEDGTEWEPPRNNA